MDRKSWDAQIAAWARGPSDDLTDLFERLIIDVELGEDADDDDSDPMSEAEMRIEEAIHAFEATPLNLRRIRSWLRSRVSAAAHERLLKSDFRALMTDDEYAGVLASAWKNFFPR